MLPYIIGLVPLVLIAGLLVSAMFGEID